MTSGTPTSESASRTDTFECTLESVPQSARRARHLATSCLADWGWGPDTQLSLSAALIIGELTANAVVHGHADDTSATFHFRMRLIPADEGRSVTTLRIDVTDSDTRQRPRLGDASLEARSGRGLLLVAGIADRWGCDDNSPSGKTVWAELAAPKEPDPPSGRSSAGASMSSPGRR
ncbi:ATP-binding protein [Yinghuangia soli]|uniref:ATP-binding protein n=1 Tax=Yinghuangia soli TaxID=2908204 RepID=A0AA41PU20_9ACTN|nr:ATP-binding protein [Yinghuangia soli]MCF2525874.1 ATP-binding protein [Yinghuangia soli]